MRIARRPLAALRRAAAALVQPQQRYTASRVLELLRAPTQPENAEVLACAARPAEWDDPSAFPAWLDHYHDRLLFVLDRYVRGWPIENIAAEFAPFGSPIAVEHTLKTAAGLIARRLNARDRRAPAGAYSER
jgi:hypothetical protein